MRSNALKILFYIRGNYVNQKSGKSPIMIRLTLNGEMSQFSSRLEIDPKLWDAKFGRAKGKSMESLRFNDYLDNINIFLTNYFRELIKNKESVSVEKIKTAFLGKSTNNGTVLDLFRKYNDRLNNLKDGGHKSPKTVEKYERAYRRLEAFLTEKKGIKDIELRKINYDFILDYENYLLTDCKYGHNTASKYMQYFRSIIVTAKNNGLIVADPFHNYQITFKKVDLGYLTEDELHTMMQKSFDIERLENVRDLFIFSCYTGLAFVDVMNLKEENIRKSFDGSQWIMTKRHKTDIDVNVPILKVAQLILDKYESKFPKGQLLPKISNQKMNAYLKEIADLCGIEKQISTHVARHVKNHYQLSVN